MKANILTERTGSVSSTGTDREEEDPEESPEEPVDENAPLFPLQQEEHIAYVSGDNDYVRPDDNLRRSEAASLVYKLLTNPAEPSGKR